MMKSRLLHATLSLLVAIGIGACGEISSVPLAASTGTPTCPATQPTLADSATFCLNAAERSDNETVVTDPTIPDSVFIKSNYTLTISSADKPIVTQAGADATALSVLGSGAYKIRSTTLAELHDLRGYPAKGQLVWIIDVTSPRPSVPLGNSAQGPRPGDTIVSAGPSLSSPSAVPATTPTPAVVYVWAEVDATSGAFLGLVG